MAKISKRAKALAEKVDRSKLYAVEEAKREASRVQTGDMPILAAIPSHVMPACFLADRISAVTSSRVNISIVQYPFLME